MSEPTICVQCEHHGESYLSHFCRYSATESGTDWVTGKPVESPTYCVDVNTDGHCPHYKAKKEEGEDDA